MLERPSFARAFVASELGAMASPALFGALSIAADAALLGGIRLGALFLGSDGGETEFAGLSLRADARGAALLCGLLVLCVFARFAFGALRWKGVARTTAGFVRDVRLELTGTPVPRGSVAKSAHRITHDMVYLRKGGENIHQFVLSLLELAVFVPWMAVLSWELAFGMLALLAPVVALLQARLHRIGVPMGEAMARTDALGRDYGDWLRLRKNWTIAAPVAALRDRLRADVSELAELERRIETRRAHLVGSAELVSGLATLAVLAGSGFLLRTGRLQVPDLVAFCGALLLCYRPLREAFRLPPVLRDAQVAWDRLRAMAASPEPAPRRVGENGRLSARGLSFAYGTRMLFRNATWTLDLSEPALLQGPNGSGKSTLFRLVAGLAEPREGEILLPGEGIDADVAYLAQDPLVPREYSLSPRDAEDRALLEALRLPPRRPQDEGVLVSSLSGGETQRLALAIVLLSADGLVLLDEPVSRLPAEERPAVLEAVRLYCAGKGLPLLVASHDPAPGFRAVRVETLLGEAD